MPWGDQNMHTASGLGCGWCSVHNVCLLGSILHLQQYGTCKKQSAQWYAQPLNIRAGPQPDTELASVYKQEDGLGAYILAYGDFGTVQEAAIEVDIAAGTYGDVVSLRFQILLTTVNSLRDCWPALYAQDILSFLRRVLWPHIVRREWRLNPRRLAHVHAAVK